MACVVLSSATSVRRNSAVRGVGLALFHARYAFWMNLFRLRLTALGRCVAKGSKFRRSCISVRFLDGRAAGSLGRDKQSPILTPGVAQESNLDAGRAVRVAGLDLQFKGSEDAHEGSPIRRRLITGRNHIHAEAWEEISSIGEPVTV